MRRAKIKSILAYADSDDTRSLKDAELLAEKMRARLKVVDVLEPLHLKIMKSTSARLAKLVREAKQDRLEKLAVRLSASGLKVRSELLEGQTETAIILEVLKNGHGLLVVSSKEDAGHRVSTTGLRLLRKCPCPVWVAGLGRLKRRLRVLAAVDALPGDAPRASLNAKVLGLADSIAQLCGGELHVLNAWHAYGEAMLRGPYFGGRPGEVDSYVQETLLHHTRELETLLKRTRIALPKSRVHLLKGEAGEIIPRFCEAEKVDVLVLGTIARTGLGAALIGNTAETVVSKIECSILAVKPDGFVCPVPGASPRSRWRGFGAID
jgi:nucleotide-binding universal stress UspA family protein